MSLKQNDHFNETAFDDDEWYDEKAALERAIETILMDSYSEKVDKETGTKLILMRDHKEVAKRIMEVFKQEKQEAYKMGKKAGKDEYLRKVTKMINERGNYESNKFRKITD